MHVIGSLLASEPGCFRVYESNMDFGGPFGRWSLLIYPYMRQNLVYELTASVKTICIIEGRQLPTDVAGLLDLLQGRDALSVITYDWVRENGFAIGQ